MPPVFALTLLFVLSLQTPAAQTPNPPAIQTPATPAAPLDPTTLVQKAMDRLHQSASDYNRFTFQERIHIVTVSPVGKPTYDVTRTYEVTWINDLPYMRLVKLNDKSLEGKDLEREQKLYYEALAERKKLGSAERAKLANIRQTKPDMKLDAVLSPEYILTEISHEPDGDDMEHLIEAHPRAGAILASKCSWRFQLWISEKDPVLRRYIADVPEPQSDFCRGVRYESVYTLVDGVAKPNRHSSRFHNGLKGDNNLYLDDTIYTNYRRFAATVTIKPAGDVEAPSSPAEHPQ